MATTALPPSASTESSNQTESTRTTTGLPKSTISTAESPLGPTNGSSIGPTNTIVTTPTIPETTTTPIPGNEMYLSTNSIHRNLIFFDIIFNYSLFNSDVEFFSPYAMSL